MRAASLVTSLLTAATPAPGSQDVNPTDGGSPGFVGFLFTFVLAIVVIGLMLLFVRAMRRVDRNGARLAAGSGTASPERSLDRRDSPPAPGPEDDVPGDGSSAVRPASTPPSG